MEDPVKVEPNKLGEFAVKRNLTPQVENKVITVLKVDEKAKYDNVIKVLNELNLAEIAITGEISKKTDAQTGKPTERKRKFTFGKLTPEEIELIKGL